MMNVELQSDVTAGVKSGGTPVWETVQQKWESSPLSKKISARFLKFLVVGGTGVFVNLAAMALLLRLLGLRDWQRAATVNQTAACTTLRNGSPAI